MGLDIVEILIRAEETFGIAILIRVPWDQANQRHVMRLELLDADGIAVEIDAETGDGSEPIVFFDDVPFEVGRPAGLKPGEQRRQQRRGVVGAGRAPTRGSGTVLTWRYSTWRRRPERPESISI